MKKLLSIALVLLLTLSLFAGCGDEAENKEPEAGTPLADAKAFLEDMIYGDQYKAGDVMPIEKDKDVVDAVSVGGVKFPVSWAITVTEGAADSVKIGTSETAGHVLIDLPDVAETDILFSAIATITEEGGETATVTFLYKMACTLGEVEILDKAFALADGQKLPGTPSITGDIVEIKTPYDANTKNITVVIMVGGDATKLVQCVGLTGADAAGLIVGDNICVKGVLGKNAGIVGFESGCTLVYVNPVDGRPLSGDATTPSDSTTTPGGSTTVPSGSNGTTGVKPTNPTTQTLQLVTDQAKILKDAFALGENATTPYIAQLTGKVLAADAYNEKYKSITVTIQVGDKTIECYQMKGNGVDKVKSGDTITVKGVIKNYFYEGATKGKVEFAWHEASGTEVTLVKLVAGATQDLSTVAKILAAAKALKNGETLQKEVTLSGKVIDIETPYDANYDNITVNFRVEGTDIKCYRLKGNGIKDIKPNDTITVKGIIKNFNGIIEFDTGCTMTKRVAGASTGNKTYSVVSSPKAGVAYKFGMIQGNVDKKTVYYLKGGMSGYYMATSSNATAAIDVYLENTTGGFYMYAMVNGKKQYINMVVSGTHVNGAYENTAKTVYTYDAAAKTVIAQVDGAPYWFGTRNDKNYTTVGPCKTEYEGFYCQFYEEK